MKRLLIIVLTVALLTTMLLTPTLADVDVNGSAIGGNMGSAVDSNNSWNGTEYVYKKIKRVDNSTRFW